MLGFRGHFATKSHRYSTTLGRLRQDRRDYTRRHHRPDGPPADQPAEVDQDQVEHEDTTLVIGSWRYAGMAGSPSETPPSPWPQPRGREMTDRLGDHISASPDSQPVPWSEERQSRVSEANRAATPHAPWTAETEKDHGTAIDHR
jgi:hypothetical protein